MTITGGLRPALPRRDRAAFWSRLDTALTLGAVALVTTAVTAALLGQLEPGQSAALAFLAAAVAGASVLFDLPGRARTGLAPAAVQPVVVDFRWGTREERPPKPGSAPPPAGLTFVEAEPHEGCAHNAAWRAGARHRHRLRWALWIGLAVLAAETVAALATGSLALLSDAGHVLTDVAGLAMALGAIRLASRASHDPSRTFGLYRLEIVAALANAFLLTGVAAYVLVEAFGRLRDPTDVPGGPLLVMAAFGLAANVAAMFLLRPGSGESLNVRGAYLEVMADAIGSVGLLAAAGVIAVTGWRWVDPVFGAAIGLWILPRTFRLGREALRVLVQAAPATVDVAMVESDLRSLGGVADVHQLHIWTLTSGMEVASAHLLLHADADHGRVLAQASRLLRERHGIGHLTLQVETAPLPACQPSGW